jgi:hypothetical protein
MPARPFDVQPAQGVTIEQRVQPAARGAQLIRTRQVPPRRT